MFDCLSFLCSKPVVEKELSYDDLTRDGDVHYFGRQKIKARIAFGLFMVRERTAMREQERPWRIGMSGASVEEYAQVFDALLMYMTTQDVMRINAEYDEIAKKDPEYATMADFSYQHVSDHNEATRLLKKKEFEATVQLAQTLSTECYGSFHDFLEYPTMRQMEEAGFEPWKCLLEHVKRETTKMCA